MKDFDMIQLIFLVTMTVLGGVVAWFLPKALEGKRGLGISGAVLASWLWFGGYGLLSAMSFANVLGYQTEVSVFTIVALGVLITSLYRVAYKIEKRAAVSRLN